MPFAIRRIRNDEAAAYVGTMFLAAGRPVDDAFVEEQCHTFELDRALAAFDGPDLIGTVGTRSLAMTLPGGARVPIAAIGQGGVLPSHTRRGVMRDLLAQALKDAIERGEPLAAWTTSEWPLYERYGAGVGTFSANCRLVGVRGNALRHSAELRQSTRFRTSHEVLALLPDLHARCSWYPGSVPRDIRYWTHLLARLESGRSIDVLDVCADQPRPFYCVALDGSATTGCAIYRIHQNTAAGLPNNRLELLAFMAQNQQATAALWSMLLHTDLVEVIDIPHAPVQPSLRWMLTDGRRLKTVQVQDHIWLRILDLPGVLRRRGLPPTRQPIIIRVADPIGLCPDATWEIESNGVETAVRPTTRAAECETDVGIIAALILGGNPVWDLEASGRLRFAGDDARARLAEAFTTCPVPFTDTSF